MAVNNIFLNISFFFLSLCCFAQADLLNQLLEDQGEVKKKVDYTFKSYKLINFETPKLVAKKHLNFTIFHRFGSVSSGIETLYGIDQASTRLQFVYGLTDHINISFSRSKFERSYDFGAKYHITKQKKHGFPFTMAGNHLLVINTEFSKEVFPGLDFTNRLRSTNQLIVASKINDKISIEFLPTVLHDGLVEFKDQSNWQFALGTGARFLLTKRMGIILDYGIHFNRSVLSREKYNNPLSIGFEVETGGHVFQIHLSNSQGMFENAFINQANGDWSQGDVFLGFNINRIFNFQK